MWEIVSYHEVPCDTNGRPFLVAHFKQVVQERQRERWWRREGWPSVTEQSVHNRCSSQACPFPRHGGDQQHLKQAGTHLSRWGQTGFSGSESDSLSDPAMVSWQHWAHHHDSWCFAVCVGTCTHKTGKRAKEEVWGHLFLPNSHSFLHFPLSHAIFLLCRASGVISHIRPKVIFALYWHPVETQKHIEQ